MTEASIIQNFERCCCLYEKICLYCGVAAVIFLLLSMIFFLALHIPQVFGEFTGRTARRAVRRMTEGSRRRYRPVTGEREAGSRSRREQGGRNDAPSGLAFQGDTMASHTMQRASAFFTAETAALPQEEPETATLPLGETETIVPKGRR